MERTNLTPGTEVCCYSGAIPRKGETLLGTALSEYEHGDRWKVQKATVVGAPVRRRGQWHVEVEHPWGDGGTMIRDTVAARMIPCTWDAFVETLSLRKIARISERQREQAAREASEARAEAVEKALEARGIDTAEVYTYGETVKLPIAVLEALLGLGK